MWCHLCRVEAASAHKNSPAHRAARELAAAAVDRLTEQLVNSVEDDSGDWFDPTNGLKIKEPEAPPEKGKGQVFYCDSCNLTLPVEELQKHRRQKEHTLELFKEQTLEELVKQYVDKEHLILLHEPFIDPFPSVDKAEAVKTYKCHLCDITVPVIFRILHERGLRHLSCRTLAVSASKRARDMLISDKKSNNKPKNKSGDNSKDISENKGEEDKSGDGKERGRKGSGDDNEKKVKFTGKMMEKLLALYIGGDIDDDSSDDVKETEEQPSTKKANALTTKNYFLDIQQFLPYIGKFYTLIADDTEHVNIKMGTEYLRIPASYYNGIDYTIKNGVNFMICRMCDGFNDGVCYNIEDGSDKKHVMSLGHIRNLMSYMDSVHLIRQIDDTHHFCALCNAYFSRNYSTDSHILKDFRHSAALAQALELGKNYKESKRNVKIMIFKPSTYWNFGIPQTPKNNFGYNPKFGNNGFNNQSNLFGGQNQNSDIGQATNFGVQNKGSLFGSPSGPAAQLHSNAAGSVFGGQSFGSQVQSANASGTVFGGQTSFGQAKKQSANASVFGGQSFGTQSMNTGFGANSQTLFGGAQDKTQNPGGQSVAIGFGSQAAPPSPCFGGHNTGAGLFGAKLKPASDQSIFGNKTTSGQNSSSEHNKTFWGQIGKSSQLADSAKSADVANIKSAVTVASESTRNNGNSGSQSQGADVANKQVIKEIFLHSSYSSDSE